MNKEDNNSIIEDIAAWLFWSLVDRFGFRETLFDVEITKGLSIFDSPDKKSILERYNFSYLSEKQLTNFYKIVAEYAYNRCCVEKTNLVGIVYLEDMPSGRSPSAKFINTKNYNVPVSVLGDNLEKLGTLCIRYPLPAGLFSRTLPKTHIFRVENTDSLGFEMPMYIRVDGMTKCAEDLWMIAGIFYIPENVSLMGKKWNKIIPNSVCFQNSASFYTQDGKIDIVINWQTNLIGKVKKLINKLI